MRILAAALLALLVVHCGPSCTVEDTTYVVPTYLDPRALDPAEGPTGSATTMDADYALHEADWTALPCEDVCQKVMGKRSACKPMTKAAGGKWEVKCAVDQCTKPVRVDGNWT